MPGVPISFSVTAGPSRAQADRERAPITGRISSVIIQVPAGCQNKCDIRVFHNGVLVAPADGSAIQGDNVVWPLSTNEPVLQGDDISLWVGNRDPRYAHTITAVATVEEGPAQYASLLHFGAESVGPPTQFQGARLLLGDVAEPPPSPPVAPALAPSNYGPRILQPQDTPPPSPAPSEGFQLAQQAITLLGLVAIGLVIAVIILAQPRRTP